LSFLLSFLWCFHLFSQNFNTQNMKVENLKALYPSVVIFGKFFFKFVFWRIFSKKTKNFWRNTLFQKYCSHFGEKFPKKIHWYNYAQMHSGLQEVDIILGRGKEPFFSLSFFLSFWFQMVETRDFFSNFVVSANLVEFKVEKQKISQCF